MKYLVHLLLFLCFMLFLTTPAKAQVEAKMPYDLSLSPPSAYLLIHQGNLALHTVSIKNNGTLPVEVKPQLVDFSTDGKTGQPILETSSTFPYLDQDKTSFETLTLKPGSTAQLTLHFTVPSDAPDQEFPLTILFKATQLNPESAAGTPVAGIIGSNLIVLVSKTDQLSQKLTISSYQSPRFIDSFNKISISPIVKNTSFAATVASGSAIITDWKGKEVAQFEINPEVVLGYSSRQVEPLNSEEAPSSDQVKPGQLKAFKYDSPFLLGPYTIKFTFYTNNADTIDTSEYKITVWAVPFALVLSLVGIGATYVYFSRKKKQQPYF